MGGAVGLLLLYADDDGFNADFGGGARTAAREADLLSSMIRYRACLRSTSCCLWLCGTLGAENLDVRPPGEAVFSSLKSALLDERTEEGEEEALGGCRRREVIRSRSERVESSEVKVEAATVSAKRKMPGIS